MSPRRFSITSPTTERIDRFLADQLSLSRTQAAQIVAGGGVEVNGAVVRRSHKLVRGDDVLVRFPEENRPRQIARHNLPLQVVFEDDSILVIDKPADLVVHPAPGHWDDTLLNALVARGVTLSTGAPGRPGIVHRLDKDTSGLMIVAKTDSSHQSLSAAIARREVKREYAALVWGHIPQPIEIDAPIARKPTDRKVMMVLQTGRQARTRVTPVARFNCCDLVRVKLETGRTHQIRVHLAHVGHPVVGDAVYGGGGARRISGQWMQLARQIERTTPRQALHAAELGFSHPDSREHLALRAEWPEDLNETLAAAAEDPGLLDRENPLEYLGFFRAE